MRTLLGIGFLLALTCSVAEAQEPITAKRLIGQWEQPGDKAKKRMRIVLDFFEKSKATISLGEELDQIIPQTYEIEGKRFIMTHKGRDLEVVRTFTVIKLTEEVLEAQEDDGVKFSFKRVVAPKKEEKKDGK